MSGIIWIQAEWKPNKLLLNPEQQQLHNLSLYASVVWRLNWADCFKLVMVQKLVDSDGG